MKPEVEVTSKIIQSQSGQAVTEYILLLAITVSLCLVIARGLLERVDGTVLAFGAKLEKKLRTGKHPPSIWKN